MFADRPPRGAVDGTADRRGQRTGARARPRRYVRAMTSTLVLLRHGQSTWNAENLFTGWWDADLSDKGREEARAAGEPVALAAREFDLLAHLGAHRGQVLSRQQLLDGVWGEGWVGDPRTVDVHVRQLRKKLGDHLPLATVWGVGYRLD